MVEDRTIAADPSWSEHDADEWADAITTAMKLGGVEHFFFVSGSEIGFYQEAVARAAAKGWPAPQLLTVTHEGSALNAALGSAMVREQPAATAAHVDVGTFNYGAGLHTAWRGSYPVLITAGAGPRAYPGSMRGARSNSVQWVQEPRDQGEIVRQYTKIDFRLDLYRPHDINNDIKRLVKSVEGRPSWARRRVWRVHLPVDGHTGSPDGPRQVAGWACRQGGTCQLL